WGETIWGLAVQYDAWPLSAWHTPSGDINRYWVGDVVTYNGGGGARSQPVRQCVTLAYGDYVSKFWADWWNVTTPSGSPHLVYPGDVICHN
ncbi:glycoside hydrolase, partial [Bifidobacterium sp. DSM 109959]|nr:glycoside hydrolase [Bifidobacterium sp. DSM 109959]